MTKTKNKKHSGDRGRRSASDIARECGLSRQRVGVLLHEGYSAAAIIRRQVQKQRAAAAALVAEQDGRGDSGNGSERGKSGRGRRPESLVAARTRKEGSLASLRELELRERRGELIDRPQAEAELATTIVMCRDRLLRLPAELRDRCDRQPGAAVEQLFD